MFLFVYVFICKGVKCRYRGIVVVFVVVVLSYSRLCDNGWVKRGVGWCVTFIADLEKASSGEKFIASNLFVCSTFSIRGMCMA